MVRVFLSFFQSFGVLMLIFHLTANNLFCQVQYLCEEPNDLNKNFARAMRFYSLSENPDSTIQFLKTYINSGTDRTKISQAHFVIGICYYSKAKETATTTYLDTALFHFAKVEDFNFSKKSELMKAWVLIKYSKLASDFELKIEKLQNALNVLAPFTKNNQESDIFVDHALLLERVINFNIGVMFYHNQNDKIDSAIKSFTSDTSSFVSNRSSTNVENKAKYIAAFAYLWLSHIIPKDSEDGRNTAIKYLMLAKTCFEQILGSTDLLSSQHNILHGLILTNTLLSISIEDTTYLNQATNLLSSPTFINSNLPPREIELLSTQEAFLQRDFDSIIDSYSSSDYGPTKYWSAWSYRCRGDQINNRDFEQSAELFSQVYHTILDSTAWARQIRGDSKFRWYENQHILSQRYSNQRFTESYIADFMGLFPEINSYRDQIEVIRLAGECIQGWPTTNRPSNALVKNSIGSELVKTGIIMLTNVDNDSSREAYLNKIYRGRDLFDGSSLEHVIALTVGTEGNYDLARDRLQQIPRNSYPADEISYSLGRIYTGLNRWQVVIDVLDSLALKGSPEACFWIANAYENLAQNSIQRDSLLRKAFDYYTKVRNSSKSGFYRLQASEALRRDYFRGFMNQIVQLSVEDTSIKLSGSQFLYDIFERKETALESYYNKAKEIMFVNSIPPISPDLNDIINTVYLEEIEPKVNLSITSENQPKIYINNSEVPPKNISQNIVTGNFEFTSHEFNFDKIYKIEIRQPGFYPWYYEDYVSSPTAIKIKLNPELNFIFKENQNVSGLHKIAKKGSKLLYSKGNKLIFEENEYIFPSDIYDIIITQDLVYVTLPDLGKVGLIKDSQVHEFISSNRKPDDHIEYKGLNKPLGIAPLTDSTGRGFLYTLDGNAIYKFNESGICKQIFTTYNDGDQLSNPTRIVGVSNQFLLVADSGNNRILKFDSDLNLVPFSPIRMCISDSLFFPIDITTDIELGYIYVSNLNGKITKYNKNGFFLKSIDYEGNSYNIVLDNSGLNSVLQILDRAPDIFDFEKRKRSSKIVTLIAQ